MNVRLLLRLAFIICCTSVAASDVGKPALGHVNFQGFGILPLRPAGIGLRDVGIPFQLLFSSAPAFQGVCGRWDCPLISSSLQEINETSVAADLPDGKRISLDKQDDGFYQSKDGAYKLEVKENQAKLTHASESWSFSNGLLVSLTTKAGEVYRLARVGGKLKELKSKDGQTLLSVNWDEDRVKSMLVDGTDISFNYDQVPILTSPIEGGSIITGLSRSVSEVKASNGFRAIVEYDFPTEAGESAKINLKITGPNLAEETHSLAWNPTTGLVNQDDGKQVEVGINEKSNSTKKITVIGTDGKRQSMWNDPRTASLFHLFDGGTQITHYISSPGPLYGKVREKEFIDSLGAKETTHRYYYSADGFYTRTIIGEVESRYGPGGKLTMLLKRGNILYNFK